MAAEIAARSVIAGDFSPGTSTPRRSGAKCVTTSCDWPASATEPGRAASTPAGVISHASRGRKASVSEGKMRRTMLIVLCLPSHLDESDFVDLAHCRQPLAYTLQRRLTKKLHSHPLRCAANLRCRPLLQNQLANRIVQIQQLMDRRPSPEACAAALDATSAFPEGKVSPLVRIERAQFQYLIVDSHRPAAELTDRTHQSLRQDAVQRGDEVVCLHTHVQEASQHIEHVVRVHGGEDKVAGQRGIDRDLRRFLVADLTHQNLVRVMAQD